MKKPKTIISRLIVGTDAFIPYIPPFKGMPHCDYSYILKTLEACYDAGFRAFEFSLYPELVKAIRTMKERYSDDIFIIGNPNWKCGVHLGGIDLLEMEMRKRVLSTVYKGDATLTEQIRNAPMSEDRRKWWCDINASIPSLTNEEIRSIGLNRERFLSKIRVTAEIADVIVLGADYADLLPLLGRTDILQEMFEIAASWRPVWSISHFTERVLAILDRMPVHGHLVPYGKYTAYFSHAAARKAVASSTHPIIGTFALLRERHTGDSFADLIRFNLESFPGTSLILGVSEPWQAEELVLATAQAAEDISQNKKAYDKRPYVASTRLVYPSEKEGRSSLEGEEQLVGVGDTYDHKPYVAISLTSNCNFNCVFCPPRGEQYGMSNGDFNIDKVCALLDILSDMGFCRIRLTGGEPFLYPHLRQCIEHASELGLDVNINTNGALLYKNIAWLRNFSNVLVRVSFSATSDKLMQKLYGNKGIHEIIAAAKEAANNCILQRLNFVLTTLNMTEIPRLLSICGDLGVSLKVFDLFAVPETQSIWRELYAPPQALKLTGDSLASNSYTERYGIPTNELIADGVRVVVKDSWNGTHYHSLCRSCPAFPCQEGLYCIVVTPSLTVVPCRLGFPFYRKCADTRQLVEALNRVISIFNESEHDRLFWSGHANFYKKRLEECRRRGIEEPEAR